MWVICICHLFWVFPHTENPPLTKTKVGLDSRFCDGLFLSAHKGASLVVLITSPYYPIIACFPLQNNQFSVITQIRWPWRQWSSTQLLVLMSNSDLNKKIKRWNLLYFIFKHSEWYRLGPKVRFLFSLQWCGWSGAFKLLQPCSWSCRQRRLHNQLHPCPPTLRQW